eukprot:3934055-Rhodomonas_salina.2
MCQIELHLGLCMAMCQIKGKLCVRRHMAEYPIVAARPWPLMPPEATRNLVFRVQIRADGGSLALPLNRGKSQPKL